MAERVVLAYSGGLDTSVGIGWLKDATEKEVVALAIDVGQGGEDMNEIRQRALDCGAIESVVVDAREEFANDYVVPALKANALYQKRYPLVSALSRPRSPSTLSRRHDPWVRARLRRLHGKGNDQVRFETAIATLAPELSSIAPVRDLALTRDKAIAYAASRNLPVRQTKKNPFSVDQNLWGRAVETGYLEDLWNAPSEELYSYTSDPSVARAAHEIVITFDGGIPVAINGVSVTPLEAIEQLNATAGGHGVQIGRIDVVGRIA